MLWGKIIGSLLGYNILWLPGAILGFYIGHMFDKGLSLNILNFNQQEGMNSQTVFMHTTFKVMGHLAKADGHVSSATIEAARNIMTQLGLNDEMKRQAMHFFNEGKAQSFNLVQPLQLLIQFSRFNPAFSRYFIEIQLQAAAAEGPLKSSKRAILLQICQFLRCDPMNFAALSSQYHSSDSSNYRQQYNREYRYGQAGAGSSDLDRAYQVLGVAKDATEAIIKKAYRKLMNLHHPDKLAAKGLSAANMKKAQEKTQEIASAYNIIRTYKNFR